MKNIDKYRGCLIGGAAGDALGYAVEFMDLDSIKRKYGQSGITAFDLQNGLALISDDKEILSIDYSWGEIDFEVSPINKMMLCESCAAPDDSFDLDIEPDDIDVSDTVTVVWEIS